ncbi:MAG: hypothetical protein ACRDQW_03805, partial [Haloechinothrix sp.]
RVGITVELQAADFARNYSTMTSGKYQLGIFAYNAISPDVSDPAVYVAVTQGMFTGYAGDDIFAALGDYWSTGDEKTKLAAVTKIQDQLFQDAPFVALAHTSQIEGRRDSVHGLKLTPWGTYDFASVWKSG